MVKIVSVFMAAMMMLTAGGGGNAAVDLEITGKEDALYTIGIGQCVKHEALDAATQGFKDVLTEKLGDDVRFEYANASGDYAQCSKIADYFVLKDVDLIMANASPMLQTAQAATTEIPILGTSASDYGLVLDIELKDGATGINVSGTSDIPPLDKQGDMIMELFPEAKNVGLVYCSYEVTSVYQAETVKAYLEGKGLKCTMYPFSDSNDIAVVTETACQMSDVIYIPMDNTAASCTGVIDGICRKAAVPVVAGEEGIARGCGAATLTISYYELGRITGEMAYKVLAEGADISTMPIEYHEGAQKKYNPEICRELGIKVPEDYAAIE